jgi:hypothetical protein
MVVKTLGSIRSIRAIISLLPSALDSRVFQGSHRKKLINSGIPRDLTATYCHAQNK